MKDIDNKFIVKFANSVAGNGRDLFFSLLFTIIIGALYAFKIWDNHAILIVFGIILPAFYTFILYRIIKLKQLFKDEVKLFKLASSKTGNILFLSIDIIILISIGVLIITGVINYFFFRLLLVLIIPLFNLLTLHGVLNEN